MTERPPPERVRLAVIGAGFWAVANHIPELASRDDVELVSVCRLGHRELEVVRRRFGFRVATEDYTEALDAGVDAVVIAVPNTLHTPVALDAIERGLHVMVEKPLAPTGADAWAIVEAARARGVHLLVPHGWQYKPFVQRAHELVRAGRIGDVRYALCHMASPTVALFEGSGGYGTVDLDGVIFEASSETWASEASAGGYALGQMSHSLGLLCWVVGLRATRVFAQGLASGSGVDIADAAVVELENGAIASVSGCGLAPDHAGFQVDLRLVGSDGMVLLDVERERCALVRHDGDDDAFAVSAGEGAYECSRPPHRFVELIRGLSVRNDSPGEAAAAAVEIIEAIGRSRSSGQFEPIVGR